MTEETQTTEPLEDDPKDSLPEGDRAEVEIPVKDPTPEPDYGPDAEHTPERLESNL